MYHHCSWGSFAVFVLYSNPYFLGGTRAAAVVVVVVEISIIWKILMVVVVEMSVIWKILMVVVDEISVIWKILMGVLILLLPRPCMDCCLLVEQKPRLSNLV